MSGSQRQGGGHGLASLLRRCIVHVGAALATLVRPQRMHPPVAWPIASRPVAIAVGLAVVVLAFGMAFVDAPVIRAVSYLPRWLVSAFDEITDFGKSGWVLWPLGILFLALASLPANLTRTSQRVLAAAMVRVGFLFAAVGLPGLFVTTVKRMIGRARPMVGGTLDPFLYSPFIWRSDYAGLPSGHTTTAFAILVAFGTLWPRARTWLLLYAVAIAISRVVVTAHYPTDVLAGALTGVAGAMLVRRWFALRGLGFSITPDGVVHQYPGPSPRRLKAVARELLAP